MKTKKEIRRIIRRIIKEDYLTPFNQMNDTELLDAVGVDTIAFIGRDPSIYNWFQTNRIQLIGGTQIWVRQNDYEVKRYIRKLIGLFKG
jgi:hypothetical protein